MTTIEPFARATAGVLACILAALLPGSGTGAATPPPDVQTLAGSGLAGFADGPGPSASFLLPTALVRAPDGTLYVTDEAAERIRAVAPNGTVTTIAGSGPLGPDHLSVLGGYRDGDALQAQFSRPDGLALAPDGSLYISDRRNACIRKLAHGVVSTFAGVCREPGNADGPRGTAHLKSPRALVFDAKGVLYVADYGVGVRTITPGGEVGRLHVISTDENRMWGIALGGEPNDPTLVASTPESIIIAKLATHTDSFIGTAPRAEGERDFGSVNQLVALDHRQFLFSDLRTSTIRYLRLPVEPFTTVVFTRTVAGGAYERQIDDAGYRDGTREDARFFVPRGIAVSDGVAYVADAGNRRIRVVTLPHFRLPESGLADTTPYDAGHYQIVYVGASWTYWDSMGDESICARIESRLDAARRFRKPVRCHTARIDAAGFTQIDDYLANYLTGHVDLVIASLNLSEAYSLYPNSAPPSIPAAAARFAQHVAALQARLAKTGTKLLILWTDNADDVSDAENYFERERDPGGGNFPVDLADNHAKGTQLMIDAVAPLPVYQLDTYGAFLAAEAGVPPPALYGTDDSHMSQRGSALVAELLARFIIDHSSL